MLMELNSAGEAILVNPNKVCFMYVDRHENVAIDFGEKMINVDEDLTHVKNIFNYCTNKQE